MLSTISESAAMRGRSARRHFFLLRELADHIGHRLVRLAIFRRKARNDLAKVVLVELRVCADLAG